MGLPALAAGTSIVGSLIQSNSQKKAGEAQAYNDQVAAQNAIAQSQENAAITEASAQPALATAQAATYNATIAGQQALLTTQEGAEQERRQRTNQLVQEAEQKGALSAWGINLSGSAMDVLRNSAANADLNALTTRHDAMVQAQAYLNAQTMDQAQAVNATAQANFIYENAKYIAARGPQTAAAYQTAAKYAEAAGESSATATLLGGATKLFSMGSGGLFGGSGLFGGRSSGGSATSGNLAPLSSSADEMATAIGGL